MLCNRWISRLFVSKPLSQKNQQFDNSLSGKELAQRIMQMIKNVVLNLIRKKK